MVEVMIVLSSLLFLQGILEEQYRFIYALVFLVFQDVWHNVVMMLSEAFMSSSIFWESLF